MGLNALYGPGSLLALRDAAGRCAPVESVTDNETDPQGNVYVTMRWKNGATCNVVFRGDSIYWRGIDARGMGIHGAMWREMLDLFISWGITEMEAYGISEEVKQAMLNQPEAEFEELEGQRLIKWRKS